MMNYQQFCERCQHYEYDVSRGILCGLTHEKPSFVDTCPDFMLDPAKEVSPTVESGAWQMPPKTSSDAIWALVLSILSFFCCSIILAPIAISKANTAQDMIAANPNLTGDGMAVAAKILAIISLVLWVLFIIIGLAQR
ncbi:DUF4190 domain-containing protein [candidate division KSB1 bacterium]|nr:DUF4190 domain-containing protein [candidate division KSB1 bacterium]